MSFELQPADLAKQDALFRILRALDGLLVAYSGGIDSAYLAWAAHHVLGTRMTAVLADSLSLPRTHLTDAIRFAEENHIPLRIIRTDEMERPEYVQNDASRCFHCKDELFLAMEHELTASGYTHIAYGRNQDDSGDFRPGQRAAANHHAHAPLAEAQLTKAEIRRLARHAKLSVWDRPAAACLSSRIQYGQPVTRETLLKVETAEHDIQQLGFPQLRVRVHGDHARIEFATEDLARAFDQQQQILHIAIRAGFTTAEIDPAGYRSGSMNALLSVDQIAQATQGTLRP